MLPAIKLVKYYGWESFFEKKVLAIRALEAKARSPFALPLLRSRPVQECENTQRDPTPLPQVLAANNCMKAINIVMVFCVPPLTAFVIFTSYEFEQARISSTLAFTTLSLFNILRFPLVVLPKALRSFSGA